MKILLVLQDIILILILALVIGYPIYAQAGGSHHEQPECDCRHLIDEHESGRLH